jgi:hypothetical protein
VLVLVVWCSRTIAGVGAGFGGARVAPLAASSNPKSWNRPAPPSPMLQIKHMFQVFHIFHWYVASVFIWML